MKPDDETLALWVEDELHGDARAKVDAWAVGEPEWLAHRDAARAVKPLLKRGLSADRELPSAEFFNARIRREVETGEPRKPVPVAASAPARRGFQGWWMPLAAAAGMVLGVWIGRGTPDVVETPGTGLMAGYEPVLYTPDIGVEASYERSESGTVIVLAGVDAIPDSWEIPETAMLEREPDHTAGSGEF